MTYSTVARYCYLILVVVFFGGAATLDFVGLFRFVIVLPILLLALAWYIQHFILVCPKCAEYLGRFRFGGYEPWLGPKCRYCDFDLKGIELEVRFPQSSKRRKQSQK